MMGRGRDYDTGFADGQSEAAVILRRSPSSASLEGWETSACSASFETPRKRAAPQDDGVTCGANVASCAGLTRLRGRSPFGEA
jgi:hypothetical protein